MTDQADDYGKSKGKHYADESGNPNGIGLGNTVYRYLCPAIRVGSIIGVSSKIIKQLRTETKANLRIGKLVPGCEERIVTIHSSSEKTNFFEDFREYVSPALDALFKVHDRVIGDDFPFNEEIEQTEITVRLLVPSDQIGCIMGRGGSVIQRIRDDTYARIRVLKDEHLPHCALKFDELLQIIGKASAVRKALYQVASRLHEYPSHSQHLLSSPSFEISRSGGALIGPSAGIPLVTPRGNRDKAYMKEFSLRIVCPAGRVGATIGKGGVFIKQVRQETRAFIKVDNSEKSEDDCIVYITANEYLEDPSATITAAVRLQPRCSDKTEREFRDAIIITRLLVPISQVGCLIGKGGSIISEMRNVTRANIRILTNEHLPKVASIDDEMVQITGGPIEAANALVQVSLRLKSNLFEKEGSFPNFPPPLPYASSSTRADLLERPKSGNRSSQACGREREHGRESGLGHGHGHRR